MNTFIFVIAGVLVVVGLALIVLSFVVGRSQVETSEESPEPSADADGETAAVAFIDEPLAADMAELMEDRKRKAAEVAANEESTPASEESEPEPTETTLETEAIEGAEEEPGPGVEVTEPEAETPADAKTQPAEGGESGEDSREDEGSESESAAATDSEAAVPAPADVEDKPKRKTASTGTRAKRTPRAKPDSDDAES